MARRHVLNFAADFAPLVAAGEKRQTIRRWRVRPIFVGDELRLYTGMRTTSCRLLGVARCEGVDGITLARAGTSYSPAQWKAQDDFARADGFASYEGMLRWFERTHGLPFSGQLIRWGDLLEPGTAS